MDELPYQPADLFQESSADGPDPAPPDRHEPELKGAEPAAPLSRPMPKFCSRCGAPWEASWQQCPHCVRNIGPALVGLAPKGFSGYSERPVRIRTALSLYFTLLAVNAVGIIMILTEAVSEVSVSIFFSLAFCVVVLFWLFGSFRQVSPGLVRTGGLGWYPVSIGLGCITFGIAMFSTRFLVSTLGIEEISCSESFLEAGYGWGMVILFICVQPAVFEELAFRGVVLLSLQSVLNRRDAVIVSALMFMVLHLMVLSFPHLLLIGLVLGYLRVRTGSLYPCMVLHFTHNLLVVLTEMKGL